MTPLGPDDLPEYVRTIDALGGPGDPRVADYWQDFTYTPRVMVDTSLDPFGPEYHESQLALYREIAGREFDQAVNEHTVFNKRNHLDSRNPYNHGEPGALATQIVQLATAMRLARPRWGARLVDMGCGWGLSSELASYLGLQVEAVDINRDFVSLVHDRSLRYRYEIDAVHGAFDTYTTASPVDMFLFYECLHHAVEPWTLLERLARMLKPGGKIVACGEPVNAHWWPHWGLRLDPMSVYCIHKLGWFESGWSEDFLSLCFERALLNVAVTTDPDPAIGSFFVATNDAVLSAGWLTRNTAVEGGVLDGDYIVAGPSTSITFPRAIGTRDSGLLIQSFRPVPVRAHLRHGHGAARQIDIRPGETRIPVDLSTPGTTLTIASETWCPAEEIGNADTRSLAFLISGLVPGIEENAAT